MLNSKKTTNFALPNSSLSVRTIMSGSNPNSDTKLPSTKYTLHSSQTGKTFEKACD